MTKVMPLLGEGNSLIKEKLIECCLRIPESIATAHSHRFETGEELKFLEDALEDCNKAVVYLEQAPLDACYLTGQVRDIFIKDIEGRALCDDLIKRYIITRRKIFNLYKAWKKFQKPL